MTQRNKDGSRWTVALKTAHALVITAEKQIQEQWPEQAQVYSTVECLLKMALQVNQVVISCPSRKGSKTGVPFTQSVEIYRD